MKKYLIALSLVGILSATAVQSRAQSQLYGDDGIAASPKLRQLLNQQKTETAASTVAPVVSSTWVPPGEFAGTPKVRQLLSQSRTVPANEPEPAIAGYSPTGPDGITASPRMRQMLEEQGPAVEIAPLK